MANLGGYIRISSNTGDTFTNAIDNDLLIYTESNSQRIFISPSTTSPAITITSNNIGIFKSNPSYNLDIIGDLNLTGNITKNGNILYNWSTYSSNIYTLSNVGIGLSNVQYPLDVIGDINITGNYYRNGIILANMWSNNSSNIFVIAPSNVGIGKSNPVYPLDVTGDINFTGTLRYNGTRYDGSQWSNNSSNIFILSSNVGIGKSNPVYPLDVTGDINVTGNIRHYGGLTGNYMLYEESDAATINLTSNVSILKTQTTYKLLSSLGTSNNGFYKYLVNASSNDITVNIRDSNDTTTLQSFLIPASSNRMVSWYNSNWYGLTDVGQWSNTSSNIYFMSNVGIGTSNPLYKLDVTGDLNVYGNIRQYGSLIGTYIAYDDTDALIINTSSNASILKAQTTYKLLSSLGTSCNVFYKYLVNASSNLVTVNVRDSNDTTTLQSFTIPSYSNKILTWYNSNWYGLNDSISAWSNSSSNIFILGSNVGIGLSNPAYSLDVIGDVNVTGAFRSNGIVVDMSSPWSITSSNVYILTSNVGIGISNPVYPLDVVGDINLTGDVKINGTRYDGSQWSNSSNTLFILNSNVGINKSNPEYPLDINGNLNVTGSITRNGILYGSLLYYDDTDPMIINTSSNVSILKAQSTYKLLSSLGVANNGFYKYLVNVSSNDVTLDIRDSNDTTTLQTTIIPASSNKIYTWYGSNWYGLTDVGQWSNTSSNVYILSSNVGIGLSNPAYALDIIGDLNVSGNFRQYGSLAMNYLGYDDTDPQIINTTSNLSVLKSTQTTYKLISNLSSNGFYKYLLNVSSNELTIDIRDSGDTITLQSFIIPSYSNKYLTWYGSNWYGLTDTNFWSNTSSNVYIIGSNIAIGKSNAFYPLDVIGDINLTGNIRQNGSILPLVSSPWATSNNNIYVVSPSNVGIFNSNPAYPLDVTGDVNFTGTLRYNGARYDGSQWSNNSSNVFIFNSNIGIGVSNANYTLDVLGDLNVTGNIRQGGSLAGGTYLLYDDSDATVISTSSNISILKNQSTYKLLCSLGASNNGFYKYLVNTSSNDVVVNIRDSNDTTTLQTIIVPAQSNRIYTWYYSNWYGLTDTVQWSNTSSNVYILGSNVGIGLSNPAYALEVAGDINVSGNFRQNGGLTFNYLLYDDTDPLIINTSSNLSVLKSTQTTYKLISNLTTSSNGFYKYLLNVSSNDVTVNIRDSGDTTTLQSFIVPSYSNKYLTWYNSNWYGLTDTGQWSNNSSNVFILSSNVCIGLSNTTYQLELSTDSAAKPGTSTWTISSDQRIKENIEYANLDRCYEIVKSIPLKKYTWKHEIYSDEQVKDRSKLGWIAQDVEPVFPKAVEKINQFGIEDCRTLNTDQIYAAMYGCIQKNQELIESLQDSYNSLSERVVVLENMINKI